MAPVTSITGKISLRFNTMYNVLLNASGNYREDKIEDWITFALRYAHLYSAESYDKQDNKSDAVDTFDRSCVDGGSSS